MRELAGRVAIVTGAAQGLGSAVAAALATAGASVALLDKNSTEVHAAAGAIHREGGRAMAVGADVTSESEVRDACDSVSAAWGRVDILVNNAGIAPFAPITTMTLAEWNRVIEVDLTGMFICTQAVLPDMLASRYGRIINVGSQLGLRGASQMTHYCAAKAGVHGFTKALARELADTGITINAVAPGPVQTPSLAAAPKEILEALRMEIPLKRFAEATEIAPTFVLLASEAGSYYTGAVLNVSGGHVM